VRVTEDVPERNVGRGTVGTVSHEYPLCAGAEREFEVETLSDDSRCFWSDALLEHVLECVSPDTPDRYVPPECDPPVGGG
jgi:hypothetical protein